MRYPYHLYDAYINIDDISINKIENHDLPPTRVQAMIESAICKGIKQGLAEIGIEEEILSTSVRVSVWEHLDGWIRCDEQLPPYGQTVLVCLEDGTRTMTQRSTKDYPRDKYNFLHVSICKDAEYWQDVPPTPKNIKAEHKLKVDSHG